MKYAGTGTINSHDQRGLVVSNIPKYNPCKFGVNSSTIGDPSNCILTNRGARDIVAGERECSYEREKEEV